MTPSRMLRNLSRKLLLKNQLKTDRTLMKMSVLKMKKKGQSKLPVTTTKQISVLKIY